MNLRRWIKLLIPTPLLACYHKIHLSLLIYTVERNHRKCLRLIRNKNQITILFFVVNASLWKYHTLYQEFEDGRQFYPIIVICPNIVNGRGYMLHEMNAAYDFFKGKGYSVV